MYHLIGSVCIRAQCHQFYSVSAFSFTSNTANAQLHVFLPVSLKSYHIFHYISLTTTSHTYLHLSTNILAHCNQHQQPHKQLCRCNKAFPNTIAITALPTPLRLCQTFACFPNTPADTASFPSPCQFNITFLVM